MTENAEIALTVAPHETQTVKFRMVLKLLKCKMFALPPFIQSLHEGLTWLICACHGLLGSSGSSSQAFVGGFIDDEDATPPTMWVGVSGRPAVCIDSMP